MDRLNLTLDIQANAIGAKRVNVRSNLMVANLIATIKDKFNLDGEYELRRPDTARSLPPGSALDQTGVAEGGTLVCARVAESTGTLNAIERGERGTFSQAFKRVWLVENRTLTEYDLAWQPAIVGRKDHRNPTNNRLLAADLEEIEELPTVSRHHACITEKQGQFYIEDIQGRNPVYVDGARLHSGTQYPLSAGDIIQVGRVWLTFNLIS